MEIYSDIHTVSLVNDSDVYSISFTHKASEIRALLQAELDDGEVLAGAIELCGFNTTKKQVMQAAQHVRVQGFGKYSGRKLWQLPQKLQAAIQKELKPQVNM